MNLKRAIFIVLIFNSFETKSMMREFHYEPVDVKYGSDSDNDFQCECSYCEGLVNWQKLQIPKELIEHKNINRDKLDKFKKFVFEEDSDEDLCSTEFDANEAKKELGKLSLEEEFIEHLSEAFLEKPINKKCSLNQNNKKLNQKISQYVVEFINLLEKDIENCDMLASNFGKQSRSFFEKKSTILREYKDKLYLILKFKNKRSFKFIFQKTKRDLNNSLLQLNEIIDRILK